MCNGARGYEDPEGRDKSGESVQKALYTCMKLSKNSTEDGKWAQSLTLTKTLFEIDTWREKEKAFSSVGLQLYFRDDNRLRSSRPIRDGLHGIM